MIEIKNADFVTLLDRVLLGDLEERFYRELHNLIVTTTYVHVHKESSGVGMTPAREWLKKSRWLLVADHETTREKYWLTAKKLRLEYFERLSELEIMCLEVL